MKYITLSLLLFMTCKEISAQDKKPEEVKGKVIGFGPNGGFLKEKQFAQSVISSDYGSQKQLEIIHQLDYKALHALLKSN